MEKVCIFFCVNKSSYHVAFCIVHDEMKPPRCHYFVCSILLMYHPCISFALAFCFNE